MDSLPESIPNSVEEINIAQLKHIKRIASGGMSEIHLYEWTTPQFSFQVAMKCLTMAPIEKRYKSHLQSEMSILADLQHENIVKTFGTVETDNNYGLVMEYLHLGSYRSFFLKTRLEVGYSDDSESRLWPLKIQIISEIIAGMKYLHGRMPKVLHLDLKSDNILLNDRLQAKICDFGLSAMSTLASLKSVTTSAGVCQPDAVPGTSYYISPTRLRHYKAKATDKSDVYSFGILLWEILTDRQPFEDTELPRNINLLAYHVGSRNARPDVELVPRVFPRELSNMMEQAWSQDRRDRPDFCEFHEDIRSLQNSIDDYNERLQRSRNYVLSQHSSLRIKSASNTTFLKTQTSLSGSCNFDELVNPESITVPKVLPGPGHGVRSTIGKNHEIQTIPRSHPCYEKRNSSPDFYDVKPNSCPGNSRIISREEEIRRFEDSILNETTPLLWESVPYIHERAKRLLSKTKILSLVGMIICVTIAVAVLVWKTTGSNEQQCPSLNPPLHGNISCSTKTEKITNKICKFSCNATYELVGSEVITCNGGRWNAPAPTCEKACPSLPEVTYGKMTCTNGYIVNSVCSFNCIDNHVMKGHAALTCLNNATWSFPEPSCVCPSCQLGDKCQYSTSWKAVENVLDDIVIYIPKTVNYGGQSMLCEVHIHGFFKWSSSCTDKDTGKLHHCNNKSQGYYNPATAAENAAAELIRDLVKLHKYPKPCDPNDMPNDC